MEIDKIQCGEKKNKCITQKRNVIIFLILMVFTLIVFFPFLQGHYIPDTYNIIEQGLKQYTIDNSFTDGRVIIGFLNLLVYNINLPVMSYVIITLIISIILSCIVVILLKKVILEYKPTQSKWLEIIVTVISYITIFNFMYLENLYFIECIVMALSLLLYTISAKILVNKGKGYLLKSLLCTIIGMLAYQGTIGFFLTLVLLFSILKNENKISNIIKDVLLSGVLVVIAGLVDLACIKIFTSNLGTNQGRLSNDILYNIFAILYNLGKVLTECCGMLPKNLLLIFLSMLILLGVISIVEKYKGKSAKEIILWFILLAYVIASTFASSVLSTSSFWAPRMRFCTGALIGILLLYLYVKTDLFQKKYIFTILTIVFLITYVGINEYQYVTIISQSKQMNKVEQQECKEIEDYINNYETTTGNKVTKIARVYSKNHKSALYLPNTINPNTTVFNSTKCWWSAKGVIYFYTGRRLEYVNATQEGAQILSNSKQEFECINDTLYIFIYQS